MPTPTARPRAATPGRAARWPVWALAVVLIIVCGLVTTGKKLAVFVLPEANPPPSTGSGPSGPGVNSWDYWTGTGDPRTLQVWVSVVAVVAFGCVAAVAVAILVTRIRLRRRARFAGVAEAPVERTFDRVVATRAVAEAVDQALDGLVVSEHFDEAIVSCWLALQAAAADSGLPRLPAETSTEYVARLTEALGLAPGDARDLARLYREARFSDHRLPETARTLAVDVLRDFRADLAGRSAPAAARHA